jgi:hypothetical protein
VANFILVKGLCDPRWMKIYWRYRVQMNYLEISGSLPMFICTLMHLQGIARQKTMTVILDCATLMQALFFFPGRKEKLEIVGISWPT